MAGLWDQEGIPHKGWKCITIEDLDDNRIHCEMCRGVEIRYSHIMEHPNYPELLSVGCECASKMEFDYAAAKTREATLINKIKRRDNWLNRSWRKSSKGNDYINVDGFNIAIYKTVNGWSGQIKNKDTEISYSISNYGSQNEAKLAAFDKFIELKN